jgi:hypothetical protein
MEGVTKALDKAMSSMDLEQVSYCLCFSIESEDERRCKVNLLFLVVKNKTPVLYTQKL